MRKVVVSTYVTLDGVFENPSWSAPYWSNEAQEFARKQLWASDALLLGRTTYEEFAASWPTDAWIEREGKFGGILPPSLPHGLSDSFTRQPPSWRSDGAHEWG